VHHNITAIRPLRVGGKVAVICAVTLAALGMWSASRAAALCVDTTPFYSNTVYQPCVVNLQGMMRTVHGHFGLNYMDPVVDGYYGPITEAAVGTIQIYELGGWAPYSWGEMSRWTWWAVCKATYDATGYHPGGYYHGAGCTTFNYA
jgi:hypothetical protein